MSKVIEIEKVAKITCKAIVESKKIYEKWSDGEWLWNAPEYLLTIKIAESIREQYRKNCLTLEDNVDYILDSANAKGRGRVANDIRKNGRSDIVLWEKRQPKVIIEVKNSVYGYKKIPKE